MRNYLLATAAATALLAAQPAYAEVLTVEYEANLNSSAGWPAGVTLRGAFTFDSEASPILGAGTSAQRFPLLSHTVELALDDEVEVAIGGPNQFLDIYNDLPNGATFSDQIQLSSNTPGFNFAGRQITNINVNLASFSNPNNDLTSANLPLGNDDISGFDPNQRNVFVSFRIPPSTTSNGINGQLTRYEFVEDEIPIPTVVCEGFKFPFAKTVTLPRKFKLPILLRVNLLDEEDNELGPETVAPPVVNVSYNGPVPFAGGNPNDLVASVLRPTEGNAFVWHDASTTRTRLDEDEWAYALDTRPFSQPGVYTVSVMPGDDSYAISPTCSGTFVRK